MTEEQDKRMGQLTRQIQTCVYICCSACAIVSIMVVWAVCQHLFD